MKRIVNRKRFNFVSNLIEILFYIVVAGVGIAIFYNIAVNTPEPAFHVKEYVIQTNDTLWDIATENKPENISIQEYIYKLQKINNITCDIKPGEKILVLKGE